MPNFSQCLLMKINFLTLRFLRCGKALQLAQSVTDLLANLAGSAVSARTVNLTVKALFTVNIRCRIRIRILCVCVGCKQLMPSTRHARIGHAVQCEQNE